MNVEVNTRQRDDQFLSTFLVASGVVGWRRGEDQKLLMAPKQLGRVNLDEEGGDIDRSRLGFDPRIEPRYLSQFSQELKRQQLAEQLDTALAELFLSEYSHEYFIDENGEIRDRATNLSLRELSQENEFESKAVKAMEKYFHEGAELVVNISLKNKKFDYPDDMVDVWKRGEGGKLTWCRFKVEMSETQIRDFFELMGGDRNINSEELLASPVRVDNYRLAEVVTWLNLAGEKNGLDILVIQSIVNKLVKRFENEFGEEVFLDSELITRLLVAARLEVENYQTEEVGLKRKKRVKIDERRLTNYLFGELKTKKVAGGGCGGGSLSGEFGNGQGIIIVVTVDGISFRKGSTEGFKYCSKCGCWYSGEKCPICK